MKLNYKRTILVGFAFFLISAFWQAYDATIALTLTNKFGMSQFWSGVIMALDNILALFLLPFFGSLSDKHKSKSGRRTPFIRFGTILAAVVLVALSLADNKQLKNLGDVAKIDDPASLTILYDEKADVELNTPEGVPYKISSIYSKDDFTKVLSTTTAHTMTSDTGAQYLVATYTAEELTFLGITNGAVSSIQLEKDSPIPLVYMDEEKYESLPTTEGFLRLPVGEERVSVKETSVFSPYTNYVVAARQSYAADQTKADPVPLILFICLLLVILLAMSTFRSPAVALMPDVTIKPLRSKANAVINLMGTAGGILVLVLGIVFATSSAKNALMSYTVYYCVLAGVMLCSLLVFLTTVKEVKWATQMQHESVLFGIEEEEEAASANRTLSKSERTSLLLILASIALWYFGYNAITSKYAVYASDVLQKDFNTTMLLAQGAAILAYIPAGILASKIGRKKAILAGVVMLGTAFFIASFLRSESNPWIMNCMFMLAGIAWATINVNSFPMVVEMCSGADVGKYTGFYYTASMAAQTATPMLSGLFMDLTKSKTVLFPYATVFVALAFVTMFFVRHGDSKVAGKKGLEAFGDND